MNVLFQSGVIIKCQNCLIQIICQYNRLVDNIDFPQWNDLKYYITHKLFNNIIYLPVKYKSEMKTFYSVALSVFILGVLHYTEVEAITSHGKWISY